MNKPTRSYDDNDADLNTNEGLAKASRKGFSSLTYLLKMIAYKLVRFVRWVLAAKEKQPDIFILVTSIMFTWLGYFAGFIFAIVIMVIFAVVLILICTGIAVVYYSMANDDQTIFTINDNGHDIDLRRTNMVTGDGEVIYEGSDGSRYAGKLGDDSVYKL